MQRITKEKPTERKYGGAISTSFLESERKILFLFFWKREVRIEVGGSWGIYRVRGC